jgi:hypothetical protein
VWRDIHCSVPSDRVLGKVGINTAVNLTIGVSILQTPLCPFFLYDDEDESVVRKRLKALDDAIEARLRMVDMFAYEYKWTEAAVLSLPCTKRRFFIGLIQERREEGGGENAFNV